MTSRNRLLLVNSTMRHLLLQHLPHNSHSRTRAFFVRQHHRYAGLHRRLVHRQLVIDAVTRPHTANRGFFRHTFTRRRVLQPVIFNSRRQRTPPNRVRQRFVSLNRHHHRHRFTLCFNILRGHRIRRIFRTNLMMAIRMNRFRRLVALFTPSVSVPHRTSFILDRNTNLINTRRIRQTRILSNIRTFSSSFFTQRRRHTFNRNQNSSRQRRFQNRTSHSQRHRRRNLRPIALNRAISRRRRQHRRRRRASRRPASFIRTVLRQHQHTINNTSTLHRHTRVNTVTNNSGRHSNHTKRRINTRRRSIIRIRKIRHYTILLIHRFLR